MLDVLTRIYGRVSVEHVVSGPGLVNIYQFTHDAFGTSTGFYSAAARCRSGCAPASARIDDVGGAAGAHHRSRRSDGRCELCAEALDLFVAAYGAEAGNLALRTVATAGVYVGGGIAPKILPALEGGASSTPSDRRSRSPISSPRSRSR